MRCTSPVFVTAVAALLAGCPKRVVVPPIVGLADFTEPHLNAVVRELVPTVEAVAGARFDPVPFVRVGRASDLSRVVQEESGVALGALYDEVPAWLLDREVRGGSADGISGKYALYDKVLFVSPEGMMATASLAPDDPDALDHVTRVVLAHELTHALQDQVAGVGRAFQDRPHYDAFEALRGVTEGHANVVEAQVARALGFPEVVTALNGAQGWGPKGPDSAASWPLWALYGQGMTFVQAQLDAGGPARMWQVLRAPPVRSRTVFVPSDYGHERAHDVSMDGHLAGVEATFGPDRWLVMSGPWVEEALRRELYGASDAALSPWLAAISDGSYRSARRQEREVTAWWLEGDGVAIDGLGLLRASATALARARTPDGRGVRAEVIVTDVVLSGADDAVRVTSQLAREDAPGRSLGVSGESEALWARRGDTLVVVQVRGFRAGARLDEAVGGLLTAP